MIFEDIKAFVAVAEKRSFSQAANYLCIAQSALSKRVQRLELQLGVSLLERHARGVALTQYGQILLEKSKHLVNEVQMLEKNLINTKFSPSGEVSIAVPQRTAGILVPRVIKRAHEKYPLIKLKIMEGNPTDMHAWTMQGDADISISYSSEDYKNSNYQLILEEPLFFFITPLLMSKYYDFFPEVMKIIDLEKFPFILPKKPSPVRSLLEKIVLNRNIKLNIEYEMDGVSSIRGMVQNHLGATIFGVSSTWHHLVDTGELLAIPFSSPSVKWKMYLIRNKKEMDSMAVTKVHELIRQELNTMLDEGVWPYGKKTS